MRKGDSAHFANSRPGSCRNHKITGLGLLEHGPHGFYIVSCKTPIALCVDVSEAQFLAQAEINSRHRVGDLAGYKLNAPKRRLVVEQDPAGCVKIKTLPVVNRAPMRKKLGAGIGASRI